MSSSFASQFGEFLFACPRWEGVVSKVIREMWWVVFPPGDRGLIEIGSLVVILRAGHVEG